MFDVHVGYFTVGGVVYNTRFVKHRRHKNRLGFLDFEHNTVPIFYLVHRTLAKICMVCECLPVK